MTAFREKPIDSMSDERILPNQIDQIGESGLRVIKGADCLGPQWQKGEASARSSLPSTAVHVQFAR